MSLICQGFMKISDFLWPLQPLKKAAIYWNRRHITIYKELWNLSWCQRPNSSVVERSLTNPAIRVRDSLEAKMELCWKNADFFLLIEKTLGNVSPCFELAFSLSFKELGSRNLKAKLWKIYIHSQIFQNYEGKNYPLTVIPVSIHRKLQNQLKFKNNLYYLNTNWR